MLHRDPRSTLLSVPGRSPRCRILALDVQFGVPSVETPQWVTNRGHEQSGASQRLVAA